MEDEHNYNFGGEYPEDENYKETQFNPGDPSVTAPDIARLKLSPVMEDASLSERDTVHSTSFEADDESETILPTNKSAAETISEKKPVNFEQTQSLNSSTDVQVYTCTDIQVFSMIGERTFASMEGSSLQASQKQKTDDITTEGEESYDVKSDKPSPHYDTVTTQEDETNKKYNTEITEPTIFEVKKVGSDTITKFEGDPLPFDFITQPVTPQFSENTSLLPEFDKVLIEPSQIGGGGKLIPGTGERNENANIDQVLTKEEKESYILNLEGMKDDEENQKSIEWLTKIDRSTYTMEYLKAEVGVAIKQALAEIVRIKPNDPIHYLGHWLFKWRHNQISHQKEIQSINELVYIRRLQSTRMNE